MQVLAIKLSGDKHLNYDKEYIYINNRACILVKVLVNATTLVKGGALQACVSFIQQALKSKEEINWCFVISKQIDEQLQEFDTLILNLHGFVLEGSPATSIACRKELLAISEKLDPDIIFTFFGPAYVKFTAPHLMGVADGWITHSSMLALKQNLNPLSLIRFLFLSLYKRYWYKKACIWVVEAECAKRGIVKRLGLKPELITVVPNTCSENFRGLLRGGRKHGGCWKIITLSTYYRHKNIEIIPYVAVALKNRAPDLDFKFILTIEHGTRQERNIFNVAESMGVDSHIVNMGPVSVKECPRLYQSCDITFMPTLLETFSAVYPESMYVGLPIVTTKLEFAIDICGSAALYYSPLDANEAAAQIFKLVSDSNLYDELVARGKKVLCRLPNQEEKYNLYVSLLKQLL